jgi:cyanophycin synthetase
VAIAELHRYLRGRDPQDLVGRLRAGLLDGGKGEVPAFPNEVEALDWMLRDSAPNDVLAITALAQRPEIFRLLQERGGAAATPERVKALVRRARDS